MLYLRLKNVNDRPEDRRYIHTQIPEKYWFFALLAPLFMTGEALMDLMQPHLMSIIVDEGVLELSNSNIGDLNLVITTGVISAFIIYVPGPETAFVHRSGISGKS